MMKRFTILLSSFCLMQSAYAATPPNIIYIMADDHTSQAIGAYGGRLAKLNPTPTLDKLAAEGMLFENCFAESRLRAHGAVQSHQQGL